MHLIRTFETTPESCLRPVLAIGNFDGVHRGHQAVLAACVAKAKALNAPPAVLTFSPHPRKLFQPHAATHSLYPFRSNVGLLREEGIKAVFVLRFTQALAVLSAQDFVEQILQAQLDVRHVLTGDNFAFGANRHGNASFLQAQSERLGFGYTALAGLLDAQGVVISSSRIRQALQAGDMMSAGNALGRAYSISGYVRHGQKRGRDLGFPTANILPYDIILPRFGVYACRILLPDGRIYDGVANLGKRPTIGSEKPLLETHILGFTGDLYGKRISVQLICHLRDEQKFATLEALKTQIAIDCQAAKMAL